MTKAQIELSKGEFARLLTHLDGKGEGFEEAAFLFCQKDVAGETLRLAVTEVRLLQPEAFEYRSDRYLELHDETRRSVIKHAHTTQSCLVEVHSHPLQDEACFSWSDLKGFDEFVPQVRWRLDGRPYGAVVFAGETFDSFVWERAAAEPLSASLVVDGVVMHPTRSTLSTQETT